MIELTLSKPHIIDLPQSSRRFKEDITIPPGTKGELIDIIIDNGEVRFLLVFKEFDDMDWIELDELEEKY